MGERTDHELIEAAQLGDRHALESLLQRHERRIYDFGLRMCRDESDAEDVLQETLLAAARNLERFRGDASVPTWLYAIARNACTKSRTRGKSVSADALEDEPGGGARRMADPTSDPAERASAREMLERVEAALGRLTPEQREVLILRDAEGLTAPEVGKALGIEPGAVKARLHRARAALQQALAEQLQPTVPTPGPDCPDIIALYSQQLEGEVDATTCDHMERHMAECPSCRDNCAALRRVLSLCRDAGDAPVPTPVQQRVRSAVRSCLDDGGG